MARKRRPAPRVPRGADIEFLQDGGSPPPESPDGSVLAGMIGEERLALMKRVIANRTRNLVLLLDNVHDPHNISAVLRSAEAFGVQETHIVHPEGKPRINAKIAQGCHRWLDVKSYRDIEPAAEGLRARGLAIYAASFTGRSVPIDRLDFSRPAAIALGNEHAGVGAWLEQQADAVFTLPMYGFTRSFNISVAAALCLSFAVRRRIELLGASGDLTPEEREKMLLRWMAADVRGGDKILARER